MMIVRTNDGRYMVDSSPSQFTALDREKFRELAKSFDGEFFGGLLYFKTKDDVKSFVVMLALHSSPYVAGVQYFL